MSEKRLSDAEVTQMVRDWFRMNATSPILREDDCKPKPEVGRGAADAAAIDALLSARDEYEENVFRLEPGERCMNCGRRSPDVLDRGGWCGRCEGDQ